MGAAIARRIGYGRTLLLADFDEAKLEAFTASMQGDGYDAVSHRVNVSDRASVASLADTAALLGPITGVAHTAGVSPQQAPVSAVLAVDLLGTAIVLEEFQRVIADGGAGVVISSMGGHMGEYPPELEQALASTATDELLALPFLSAGNLTDSGAAYSIAKRANQLRVRAAAPLWGEKGARINSISPGIISTPMGQLERHARHARGVRGQTNRDTGGHRKCDRVSAGPAVELRHRHRPARRWRGHSRVEVWTAQPHTSERVMSKFDNSVDGAVALVTGAAGGIGLGIARALLGDGAKVALADVDSEELARTVASLREAGLPAIGISLDVTDRDAWALAVAEVGEKFGDIDLLVNNAGISTLGMKFDDIEPALWDKVVDINLNGVANGIRAALPAIDRAGGGYIVNTASMGGVVGFSTLSAYNATKFGVVGLTESLRQEFAERNISVSVLLPASVNSRLWRTSRRAKGLPDQEVPDEGDISGQSAMGHGMAPEEVGQRVLAAIKADELYIFSHAEVRPMLAAKNDGIMNALDHAEAFVQ
jgi:NAD(P)-dependent dehydrogenase (short-subunit alcohol dehydrogenase family)